MFWPEIMGRKCCAPTSRTIPPHRIEKKTTDDTNGTDFFKLQFYEAPKVRTTRAQGKVQGNGATQKCEGQQPDLTTKAQKTTSQTPHDLTPIHAPRKNAKGVSPTSPGLVARQKTYPRTNTTTPIRPNKKLSASQTFPTFPTFRRNATIQSRVEPP